MGDHADSEPQFQLSLKGEGVDFAKTVGQSIALVVINAALGGAAPGSSTPRAADEASSTGEQPAESPGEFIEATGAVTNVDKIVAFAAYLHDRRGRERFSREDVKAMFRAAHEPLPGNFPRDFKAALSSRALDEDAPDRHYLTRTGRSMVDDKFPAAKTAKRGRRPANGEAD